MPGDSTPGRTHKDLDTSRRGAGTPGGGTPGGSRKRPPIDLGRLAEHAELIERIGRGGFGEVWRVRYLGSEEVWKFIPVTPGEDNQALKEAIHARRVDHRNVVKVHDIIRQGNHHILRMDLVRGRDLHHVVNEDGVLPADQAIAFMKQVASALRRAHDHGVVHLDLKPHNLLLCDDGATVMVTDFGISASLARDLAAEEAGGRGTPYFVAPEQALPGQRIGPAADIWSFGVTLYYLLSRRYPFDFDQKDAVKILTSSEPIPLSQRVPFSFAELDALLSRCVRRDPLERFPSMEALSLALDALLGKTRCPDCGHELAIELAPARCPVDGCQSAALGPWKDATLALRAGDRAFALSLFDEARAHYGRAVESPRRDEALKQLEQVAAASADHDQQVAAVSASLEAGQLLDAFRSTEAALVRHSRSRELRDREHKLAAMMVERYQSARERVEGFLRQAKFVEARKYLTLIDAMISFAPARDLLLGDRDEPGPPAGFSAMYATIEEREQVYEKLDRDINAAIATLNFVEGRNLLDRLQSLFPSAQNLERMRQLAQSGESMRFLDAYPITLLQGLLTGSAGQLPGNRKLELAKAQQLCSDLLRAHDPEVFPRMQEIAERRSHVEAAIKLLRAHAEQALESGSRALEECHPERARITLESVRDVFSRTDLFGEQKVDEFRRVLALAAERSARAEELYREACRSEELRQFSKALTIFEEVQRLDPERYLDLSQHAAACQEKAALRLRLNEESRPLFVQLTAEEPTEEVLERFLDLAGKFDELQDDGARLIAEQELAEVVGHYLMVVQRRMAAEDQGGKLVELKRVLTTLAHMREDHWTSVLSRHSPFAQRVTDFGVKVAEPPPGLAAEEALGYLEQAATMLQSLRVALRSLGSDDHHHPCLKFADVATQLVEKSKGTSRIALSRRAAALLQSLEPLCPRGLLDQLENARSAIVRSAQRSAFLIRGGRVARALLRQVLPISAGIVFLIIGVILTNRLHGARRVRAITEPIARIMGEPDLVLDRSFATTISSPWWSLVGPSKEADRTHASLVTALAELDLVLGRDAPSGRFEQRCAALTSAMTRLAALPPIRDRAQRDLTFQLRRRILAAISGAFAERLAAATGASFTLASSASGSDQLALLGERLAIDSQWLQGLAGADSAPPEIEAITGAVRAIDAGSLQVAQWMARWDGKSAMTADVPAALDQCAKQHATLLAADARLDRWVACLEADRLQRALRSQLDQLAAQGSSAGAALEGELWLVLGRLAQLMSTSRGVWTIAAPEDAILRALSLLAAPTGQ